MARRQRLSETQITALFDPPADHRELVRHYTFSDADLAAIRRCRCDHNRLGRAIMLCYLRFPGRALRAGERPSAPLLEFMADQIGVFIRIDRRMSGCRAEPTMSRRRVAGQAAVAPVRKTCRYRTAYDSPSCSRGYSFVRGAEHGLRVASDLNECFKRFVRPPPGVCFA